MVVASGALSPAGTATVGACMGLHCPTSRERCMNSSGPTPGTVDSDPVLLLNDLQRATGPLWLSEGVAVAVAVLQVWGIQHCTFQQPLRGTFVLP